MEPNELVKPTEDEQIFNSLSSGAAFLEAQSVNDLKTPDVVELLKGDQQPTILTIVGVFTGLIHNDFTTFALQF
jgi:hypothetical protein